LRVALIGHPNTGKSTLFNALAGMRTRTGNYPGVTVEQRTGVVRPLAGEDGSGAATWELIDLPGTYGLAPRSADELVTVDVLTGAAGTGGQQPDVILCVCNASLAERTLFLVSQLLELGTPVVLALNMADAAAAQGIEIDVAELQKRLGIPVVLTSATRGTGLVDLRRAVETAAAQPSTAPRLRVLPDACYATVAQLRAGLTANGHSSVEEGAEATDGWSDYFLERALLDEGGQAERRLRSGPSGKRAGRLIESARAEVAAQCGALADLESNARVRWARAISAGVVRRDAEIGSGWTDRLDAVFTHRIFGLVIFAALMLLTFQLIGAWAQPLIGACEALQERAAAAVQATLSPGMLRSLLIDGVIGGVGGVLVFVPQIALLFLLISILEDCGYMARAAFLIDRPLASIGLSGKSFLPLVSSFACAVPGIMATRTIEHWRDRLMTILVAPLMSCSARLPVYFLLITALIPQRSYVGGWVTLHGLVLLAMYAIGPLCAIVVCLILRNTLLKGEASPFVMELPEYRWPVPRVVVLRVWDSVKAFVYRAGTLILAATVLIWFAGYVPGDHTEHHRLLGELERQTAADANDEAIAGLQQAANTEARMLLEQSLLGRAGHLIEPLVRPLGWDWRIGIGAIASFPAREVIIATLGTIYSLGADVDEQSSGLVEAIRGARWPDSRPVYTLPVGLSIMVFFALCAQCVSTLLVIRRETGSWRWPVLCFVYMTALAYVGAWLTFRIGTWLMG
jgi:ferrous iron transport protein B